VKNGVNKRKGVHFELPLAEIVYIDRETTIIMFEEILHKAVNEYLGYPEGHDLHDEAKDWLFYFQDDDAKGEKIIKCTFDRISRALGINKDRFRFILNDYKDKRKKRLLEFEFGDFLSLCKEKDFI